MLPLEGSVVLYKRTDTKTTNKTSQNIIRHPDALQKFSLAWTIELNPQRHNLKLMSLTVGIIFSWQNKIIGNQSLIVVFKGIKQVNKIIERVIFKAQHRQAHLFPASKHDSAGSQSVLN